MRAHSCHRGNPRTCTGFTLQELMVSLTIGGALFGGGLGLYGLVRDHALTAEVNGLMTHLSLARSEAINRRQPVTLCRSRDLTQCARDATWQDGWIVFADPNRNGRIDDGESPLRVHAPPTRLYTLRYGETGSYAHVTYAPNGYASPNGTFTFCEARRPDTARAIVLHWTGRPRVSSKAADGRPLRC